MSITDAELLELERLVREQEIYERREALKDFFDNKNPNYTLVATSFSEQKYETVTLPNGTKEDQLVSGKRGVVLEGSSRSGKTYSTIEFIIYLCLFYHKKLVINILKETYNEFKTTINDDFNERLAYYDIPSPFHKQEVHSFKINGSKINLLGADKTGKDGKFHGASCDILYANEALSISQKVWDQSEMRCRLFWIMDYNPSVTEHWVFKNILDRTDVGFIRTTFRQNPFVSVQEKQKILSYEPWLPGSYDVVDNSELYYNGKEITEKNQPPPHPTNIAHGTADEFMWKVYGMGLRGAMKGLIFKHVTWIDKFPDHIAPAIGMDFGFTTDPCAIVKHGEDKYNIYLELLCYHPIESPEEIDAFLTSIGISKSMPITADSADKYTSEKRGAVEMVRSLFNLGWSITKVRKSKNVMFWLASMKTKKIHIVKNHLYPEFKKEKENYRLKEINGIAINQPIDDYNHCFIGSTSITTIEGEKQISEIKKGDIVLTSKGYRPVLERHYNGVKPVAKYCLKFDTFSLTLISTTDHLIKTNNGWKEISKLKSGQAVYLSKHSMEKHISCIRTQDILAKETRKCTGPFGNISMVEEFQDFTSITGMVTTGTTVSKTWNKLKSKSIYLSIANKNLNITQNGLKNLVKKVSRLQKNGTHHLKGENGILSMRRNAFQKGSRLKLSALNASRLFMTYPSIQNSVPINVNHPAEENQESTTKAENVCFAGINSFVTNTQKQDAVLKFVLVKIDSEPMGQMPVYDLAVHDVHEYFANGLLVHNCWDAARYAHMAHDFNNLTTEWN